MTTQSEIIRGKANVPTSGVAGALTVQYVKYLAPRAIANSEVIELAILPAGNRLADLNVMAGFSGKLQLGFVEDGELLPSLFDGDVVKGKLHRLEKSLGDEALEHEDKVVGAKCALAAGETVYLQLHYAF